MTVTLVVTSITTVYATHRLQHLKHSWHVNYNSFILMVAIIGVDIYSTEAGGYNAFDSHARDMYHNSHSEGTCVLLEIPSMHKLVQYFQTLHRNEDIYELKGVHIDHAQIYAHTASCSLSFSRTKELLFWLSRGLNRLTCVTHQIRGDSKLRD